jgi:hypothetical protein
MNQGATDRNNEGSEQPQNQEHHHDRPDHRSNLD